MQYSFTNRTANQPLTDPSADQGQGGAQSIEDGVALGIALVGALPADVPARLRLYDAIRRVRGSLVQIFSNAGQDQAHRIRDEAARLMVAESLPSASALFPHVSSRSSPPRQSMPRLDPPVLGFCFRAGWLTASGTWELPRHPRGVLQPQLWL
jgi:hypothetical protein